MAQTKDFYAVLGVSASATQDEIKKQYRKLAKRYHPDANANDPKAAERFKEISEAHNVLGDAEKRKQYNDMRRLGAFGGFGDGAPFGAGRGASARRGGAAGRRRRPCSGGSSFRFEDFDIGGLGGLGDLFSNMFNGARGAEARPLAPSVGSRSRRRSRCRSEPRHWAERSRSSSRSLSSARPATAPAAPLAQRTRPVLSATAGASYRLARVALPSRRTCPVCLGRGRVPSQRCPTCNGMGEVRSHKRVLITVPPGTDTGSKVRLRGQGGKGADGGAAGDIVITFQVQPDRFFRRDGLDVIATVPLNIAQATLGSRISVRTLDGKKVALRIPEGTPAGKRFRVPGQGIQKDGKTGDLIVEVRINVPEHLTEDQQRMMREFAAAGGLKY